MFPTFSPGDELLVDTTPAQSLVDGLYAVRVDDTLMVKRLQHLPGGRVLVRSDNPAYQAFETPQDDERFAVVGRVIWAGRSL